MSDQHTPSSPEDQIIELFLTSFPKKVSRLIGGEERARSVLRGNISLASCLTESADDRTIAMLCMKDGERSWVDTSLTQLWKTYRWRTPWYALLLFLFDHRPQPGELHVDILAVSPEARGQGLGTALLKRAEQYAQIHGYETLSLEVVNTNSRAQSLYEREGYQVSGEQRLSFLSRILGLTFDRVIQMRKPLQSSRFP